MDWFRPGAIVTFDTGNHSLGVHCCLYTHPAFLPYQPRHGIWKAAMRPRLHIASGGSPGSTMDRSLGSNKHMLRSCPSVSGHRAWSRIWGKAPAIGGLITKLPIGRFVASAEIGFGSIKVLRLPMCYSIGFISPNADPGVRQSLLRDSCETIHSRRVTFRYGAVIPKSTFCMCLIATSRLFLGRLRS